MQELLLIILLLCLNEISTSLVAPKLKSQLEVNAPPWRRISSFWRKLILFSNHARTSTLYRPGTTAIVFVFCPILIKFMWFLGWKLIHATLLLNSSYFISSPQSSDCGYEKAIPDSALTSRLHTIKQSCSLYWHHVTLYIPTIDTEIQLRNVGHKSELSTFWVLATVSLGKHFLLLYFHKSAYICTHM